MKQTFKVEGMTCGHCANAVTQAVKTVDPQAEVEIDLGSGRVEVQSEGERAAIAQAIQEEGYTVAG